MNKKDRKAIFVIGPTASGKTSLGVFLAKQLESEVISIDSRQVYQGLDLGTGKDLADFGVGSDAVKYHLIDVVDPKTESYSIHRFVLDAVKAMESIWAKGKTPILVGGSSLYTNALINRYALDGCEPNPALREKLEKFSTEELVARLKESPAIFERTDTSTRNRLIRGIEVAESSESNDPVQIPDFDYLLLAPYFHRKVSHQRIEQRLNERFEEGMVAEVQLLFDSGVSWEKLDWFGLEYRFIANFLKGELSEVEMKERLLIKIRQFCKSQDIWLRKMEREGKDIYWLPEGNREQGLLLSNLFLEDQNLPEPLIRLNEIHYGPKQPVVK